MKYKVYKCENRASEKVENVSWMLVFLTGAFLLLAFFDSAVAK